MLILTRQTLIVANIDEGGVDKIYLLKELTNAEHIPDPTLLCLYCLQTQSPPERSGSPIEYPEVNQKFVKSFRLHFFLIQTLNISFKCFPKTQRVTFIHFLDIVSEILFFIGSEITHRAFSSYFLLSDGPSDASKGGAICSRK